MTYKHPKNMVIATLFIPKHQTEKGKRECNHLSMYEVELCAMLLIHLYRDSS